MARANRLYLPGLVWHITHRCHKREFLLKFHCYRKRWLYWLYQAKQRFHISILNYMVTSNHVHMLAVCDRKENDIAKSIHLASGRTAWEYNQRRKRRGSFWEDRYHATAVETDRHLFQCMVYIDMNMVRAGIVKHPADWSYCGYQEIIGRKQRYTLIDQKRLMRVLEISGENLKLIYNTWIGQYLELNKFQRDSCWTESVAVGNKDFIEHIKARLEIKVKGGRIIERSGTFELREPEASYQPFYPYQNTLKGLKSSPKMRLSYLK